MAVTRIVAPVEEPVSVDDLKRHCVIDFDDDDMYLGVVLTAAREIIERESGLLFVEQVWQEQLDGFCAVEIELSKAPVRSVEQISYVASDGQERDILEADYQLNGVALPALLAPAYGRVWPGVRSQYGAVKIRYRCGFSAADEEGFVSVPAIAKQAIMMQAKHLYENRERVSPVALHEQPCAVSHLIGLIQVVGL